jgi:spore germination protein
MYKRISAVLFPITLLALVGTAVWGYQENQEKNSILIKAENQYQRAFHDLSYHMEQLHNEIGNAVALNSASDAYQRKTLLNVWRITSEAQSEINQLPLSLLPFHKTEEFLSKIASFSYQTAMRDLRQKPLSDDESKTLLALYKHSKEITAELRNVQSKILGQNLRWMDVEVAMATEDKQMDNTIIDGFKTVDKRVEEYSEVNWGPTVDGLYKQRNFSMLSGPIVKPEDVKKKAAEFLGLAGNAEIRVVENGKGTRYHTYSVTAEMPGSDRTAMMDFTRNGGKLIWFMNDREVPAAKLSAAEAGDKARQFLKRHGFGSMQTVNYDEFEHIAHITLAAAENNVIIYPEKVAVQVALDNGEILGLHAADYWFEHRARKLNEPKLSLAEAKKTLNPNFELHHQALALIDNDVNEEVLCYQFYGRINGSFYRIYVNADTGTEEKIERIG